MIGHRRCCYGRAEAVGFRDPALGPAQREGAHQGEFGYQVRTHELMLLQREALLQRTRLLGPAFVAAVGYVDPGNVATNT